MGRSAVESESKSGEGMSLSTVVRWWLRGVAKWRAPIWDMMPRRL